MQSGTQHSERDSWSSVAHSSAPIVLAHATRRRVMQRDCGLRISVDSGSLTDSIRRELGPPVCAVSDHSGSPACHSISSLWAAAELGCGQGQCGCGWACLVVIRSSLLLRSSTDRWDEEPVSASGCHSESEQPEAAFTHTDSDSEPQSERSGMRGRSKRSEEGGPVAGLAGRTDSTHTRDTRFTDHSDLPEAFAPASRPCVSVCSVPVFPASRSFIGS